MISRKDPIPALSGLVLAGGKSTRMGTEKDLISWHGVAQRYFLAKMLQSFCAEVFISCRADQEKDIDPPYRPLPDRFPDRGPFGGVLSALSAYGESAWLVVACDLPLLNEETVRFLVQHRAPQKIATTYSNPQDGLPEPMITIWEPASYPVLCRSLEQGGASLREVLIRGDKAILTPPWPEALMNVNTPEEAATARKALDDLHRGHRKNR